MKRLPEILGVLEGYWWGITIMKNVPLPKDISFVMIPFILIKYRKKDNE